MPRKLIATSIHKMEKGKLYGDLAERERNEPRPLAKIEPKCPRYFDKEERQHWKFYKTIAKNYGLFVVANAPALERLGKNSALLQECYTEVKLHGMFDISSRGTRVKTFAYSAYLRLQDEIRKDEDRIGANTQAMAKVGSSLAIAKKREGIEALMD